MTSRPPVRSLGRSTRTSFSSQSWPRRWQTCRPLRETRSTKKNGPSCRQPRKTPTGACRCPSLLSRTRRQSPRSKRRPTRRAYRCAVTIRKRRLSPTTKSRPRQPGSSSTRATVISRGARRGNRNERPHPTCALCGRITKTRNRRRPQSK